MQGEKTESVVFGMRFHVTIIQEKMILDFGRRIAVKKCFNTAGDCKQQIHYMVDISDRLEQIRTMVDAGMYFTINRARQCGKTTMLRSLEKFLEDDYVVVSFDFQTLSYADFEKEELSFPKLKTMIHSLLFQGQSIVYNPDDDVTGLALMFGFVKTNGGFRPDCEPNL